NNLYKHQVLRNTIAPKRYYEDINNIQECEVREALRKEAKKHKYWKGNVAGKMLIENIQNSACLHYVLESFTEMRSTTKATEGATLESCTEVFNPWKCVIEPAEDFVDQVKIMEMPGTSDLSACITCSAEGLTHCFFCRGYGTDKCAYCRGTGMKAGVAHPAIFTHPLVGTFPHPDLCRGYPGTGTAVIRPTSGGSAYGVGTPVHFMAKAGVPPPGIGQHDLCHFCQGRGIRGCSHCKGNGRKTCSTCGGSGSIRSFVKLRIQFSVERSDYYTPCDIPQELLQKVTGQIILNEVRPYVLPIRKYPEASINENSRKLCTSHLEKCLGRCRILKQRHYLEAIPIARIQYRFGSQEGVFWVYGSEHLCFIPHYPAKCAIF
ncbi:unnamed protein product, partial [Dracunculus medinensis]|uniref:Protein SSUH2-like protein n=1 Tax=Dracunculus medinensis TaxID=318479 RepID=A0A0N4U9K2_DRAME